jgi:hypothetical protein
VAIKIPLVADVDKAIRGVEDVADAFDKVQDALEDVTKDAKKTEDALEDVGDGGKKAGEASDDMAKKFRDDFDKIRTDSKSAGDGIGRNVKDGTGKAGEGMDELKDEAGSTAREVGASFDGSASSIAEGFQEVAANAFAGFGPAGAAAGLAAAAGIGIAIAKLTEYAEKINEAKTAGASWAAEFNTGDMEARIDAIRSAWADLGAQITDSREWYEITQDAAISALDNIAAAARGNVAGVEEFLNAFNNTDPADRLAGFQDALETVNGQIDELGPAWKASLGGPAAEEAYIARKKTLTDFRDRIKDQLAVQQTANELEEASADAIKGTAAEIDHKNQLIEESNDLLEENVDANRSVISAEFDLADAQKELNKAIEDGAKKGRSGKEALFEYSDSILSMADAAAEASGDQADYNEEISAGRRKFLDAAAAMGYTKDEANRLARQMGLIPRKVEITATDNETADKTRRKVEDLLSYAGVKKDVTLGVHASTAQASIDVANWRHAQQSIPVQIGMRAV